LLINGRGERKEREREREREKEKPENIIPTMKRKEIRSKR
jgi:hypothetical protein